MISMNKEMAETLCGSIRSKKSAQAVFSDCNPTGFRIRSINKTSDDELYATDFVMVADRMLEPEDLMTEWNMKVADIEANA